MYQTDQQCPMRKGARMRVGVLTVHPRPFVRMSMKVFASVFVFVTVEVNPVPRDASQHIRAEEDQHQADAKFQQMCKARWHRCIHEHHDGTDQE